jgi:biopolymer transport protein ExbD
MNMTLHSYRWSFTAARVSMWLMLIATFSVGRTLHGPDVPQAPHATAFVKLNSDIEVRASDDGVLIDDDWRSSHELLVVRLRWFRAHNPRSRVVVRAEGRTRFGVIREAMLVARDSGVAKLTFLTRTDPQFVPIAFGLDRTYLRRPPAPPRSEGDFSLTSVD